MSVLRLVPSSGAPIEVDQDVAVVGREPGVDVLINDGSVSRRHARLERRGSSWFVIDQGSANGTFLDSQRVSDAVLRPGQELRFGAVGFRVDLLGDMPATDGTMMAPMSGLPYSPAPPPRPAAPPPPARPSGAPPAPWPSPSTPGPPPPAGGFRPAPPAPATIPGAPAAAGPPPGVGEASDAPPPPRRGKGPVFWIATGCGSCLVVLVVLFLLLLGLPFLLSRGPVDAVRGQLREVKAGQTEAAYARLSTSYREVVSREAFAGFVLRHPALKDNADSTFLSRSIQNDRAELEGFLTGSGGEREQVRYRLEKEGGDWKVTAMEVASEAPEKTATAAAVATPTGLQIEPAGVEKRVEGDTVRITIKVTATGFQVRPEGGRFVISLAEDVETLDPAQGRIDELSRRDVQEFEGPTTLAQGSVATISTPLILAKDSVTGTYTVKVTVRDRVGGGQATRDITFELP
jgi:hypothetical protein